MRLSKKHILFILFTLFFVVSLVPIFLLGNYAIPYYDDFNHGLILREALQLSLSSKEIFINAINYTIRVYNNWQGTYFSIFLSIFMPAAWGIDNYFWTPIFLVSSLVIGELFFSYVIFKKVYKLDTINALVIAVGIAFFAVQNLPSASEGFYWWAGGVMHTFPYALLLITLGFILIALRSTNNIFLIVSCSLILITSGGAHQVALLQFTSLFALMLFFILNKSLSVRKSRLYILTFFSLIGVIINVFAPGNFVRVGNTDSLLIKLLITVVKSFVSAILYGIQWCNINILFILCLIFFITFPLIKSMKYINLHPLIVFLLTFCVYSSSFSLGIFGYGTVAVAPRYINTLYWTFWWFTIINFLYIMQYYRDSYFLNYLNETMWKVYNKMSLLCCIFCFFISIFCGMIYVGFSDATSTCALSDLLLPSTKQFYESTKIIFSKLESDENEVIIPELKYTVRLLLHDNFNENDKKELIKKYYDKKDIIIDKNGD